MRTLSPEVYLKLSKASYAHTQSGMGTYRMLPLLGKTGFWKSWYLQRFGFLQNRNFKNSFLNLLQYTVILIHFWLMQIENIVGRKISMFPRN